MKHVSKFVLVFLIFALFISILYYFTRNVNFAILNPRGLIAYQEKNLIIFALGLMLSVAIPVVLATYFIAWKYRVGNRKAKYTPDATGSLGVKILWWGILTAFVGIFWVIVWQSAHALDPYKPLDSNVKPIIIQVVALRWKWLFIYPDQKIATVNFIQFPVSTPVNFFLTAGDAPMNSFWIPNLGGQMYAMTTMETKLHLQSDTLGDYPGGAAEINGSGFAGMRFTARVSTEEDFNAWVEKIKKTKNPLTKAAYKKLAVPSEYNPIVYYSSVDSNLYNSIIMQYMEPNSVHPAHAQ